LCINAKRSEESLVNEPMNCAPTEIAAGLQTAPTAVSPTAGPPTAPAFAAGPPIAPATTPLPALAVPIAYANSPQQPRHRHETLSTNAVSSLQTAWTDLTPSLDHQDFILAVNRRYGSNLTRLPSAADGALFAQRTRGNILSATTAVETAQTLAAELSAAQQGFPKDPRQKHGNTFELSDLSTKLWHLESV